MPTATSSKTGTAVAALAALGLSAAAGFGYWGYQNWDEFNSDYYKKGYAEEMQQADAKIELTTDYATGTPGYYAPAPAAYYDTPGYSVPGDLVPGYYAVAGYSLSGEDLMMVEADTNPPNKKPPEEFVQPVPMEKPADKKQYE